MVDCKLGCGKSFKDNRGRVAHETHKCRKRIILPCECPDGGSWELLNRVDHPQDIANGHKKYCTECREVV